MTGTQRDPDLMESICKRIHAGEFKQALETETGISTTTQRKYYRGWCKKHGYTERPPGIYFPSQHKPSPPVAPPSPVVYAPIITPPYAPLPPLPPVGKRIASLPDMQVKPHVDLSYCSWVGCYLAEKKPDIIINGGDFGDMPSLSLHDVKGSKRMEGARYEEDILAVQTGMKLMMTPIREEMARSGWNPRLVMLYGNHEYRIKRALENDPMWEGKIGLCDLHYEEWGWEVHQFLEPVVIEGIVFSHYFCSGVMGKPITTARALLNKLHMSCIAYHQQGRDIAFGKRANGKQITAILSGSCYPHDEHFLNPQTNNHWRGLYMLNDVIDGEFEEMAVSLKYLRRKYG